MRGRERMHVVDFAIGPTPVVIRRSIPACHAGLDVDGLSIFRHGAGFCVRRNADGRRWRNFNPGCFLLAASGQQQRHDERQRNRGRFQERGGCF